MQKIRKNLTVNFSKKLENLILDQFWSILVRKPQKEIFPQKTFRSTLRLHFAVTFIA